MPLIPIYRAKSNERKNTYVEGLLIGIDEELNLCTIRTKDDYIGGEICYLHTLSINFPDMLDSQGNKIFASLQEDGKGGDTCSVNDYIYGGLNGVAIYQNYGFRIDRKGNAMGISFSSRDIKIIGIQQ